MYINKAFELVKWTEGQTGMNPAVGCVIVKDDRIVGIGAHLTEGEAHAEVNAINMAGIHAKGATLYCTLEPCSHHGRTSPCTKKIVNAGIKKVVYATSDVTLSSGVKYMQSEGIEIEKVECKAIDDFYAPFFMSKTASLPYVTIKMATTIDGKTADDESISKWITNEKSRAHAHKVRYGMDAVMVGYNTYKEDTPTLDARLYKDKYIKKVIVTNGPFVLNTQDDNDYDRSRLIIVSTIEQHIEGVTVIHVPHLSPEHILKALYKQSIRNLLIEGGMQTIRTFIEAKCYNEIHHYIAPKLLGGTSKHQFLTTDTHSSMRDMTQFKLVSVNQFDDDVLLIYRKA
ncbi:bifunctional diaminohydroxyphosphoribosylaminopyrimidine deaminase/5-amino-6-(5-phosphoribosylamino)uracil reductase RibD [Macrococcus armenti]|uniref:bifunctional diaminohydroxyphosphoribosylaminopyrimidine deaminase/5-amino-6-(5-phosphoribosylamino)uracil reductase RibD n=1 Tax=Macrococcus armenti TaxID=2875764 RepID=UPI001CD03F04|nr:bifunctional diaminohydroxyphosphoribosylaminopyrimidine deaminase/5-amino-6-(5-phosphoribosylamino)uracil reductase RibD [Macrococcus armenti]UBH08019.1 bifunctional diaminohydroxyphosphoribosylaminopyrimidine deaminase/5-amino-6-(5-phosphoribosylamino)uracil reductase RibD [Macrococcus armenti]UBH10251.1 bifunctional diaminohydroxyphosphoribosylaminopyrimidine deaminase/5-amino-6-(5-phosphoribosylamino)uracil reductase RibD [Macrococcus armenti]